MGADGYKSLYRGNWKKNAKCFFDHLGGEIGLKFLVVARFTMGNLPLGDGSHIYHLYRGWVQELMERKLIKTRKYFFDHLDGEIGLKFLVLA